MALRRAALAAFLLFGIALLPASAPADHNGPLAAQWHLDELSAGDISTTPDSSGHGLDAVEGASDGGVEGTAGRFGLGVLFDTNTPLLVGPAALLEPAYLSVVAWVRGDGSPGINRIILAKGGDSGCTASSWALGTASGGLEFYVRGPGESERFSSPFAFAPDVWDGQWHAVAGTYDGTTVRLYLDGAEVGSGTAGPTAIDYDGPDRTFAMGQYPACTGLGFAERLDEVQVYRRALTAAEIATLHDPAATSPRVIGPDEGPGPPPPTGSPPRNMTPPAIRAGIRPGLYVCNEGTWEGADADFEYRWYRIPSLGRATRKLVATTYGYTLPAAQRGARFVCEVIARNSFGSTTAGSPVTILTGLSSNPLSELVRSEVGNVRIRGIDIFQVVQPSSGAQMFGFPSGAFVDYGDDASGGTPTNYRGAIDVLLPGLPAQRVTYDGVPLDAGKPATAVVYASMSDGAPAKPNQPLEVTLRFKVGGRTLSEDTQIRLARDLPVTPRRVVTAAQRDDPASGIQFTVPGWVLSQAAGGALELEAEFRLPAVDLVRGLTECRRSGCFDDNRFRLTSAPVFRAPRLSVYALQLLGRNQTELTPPDDVLAAARRLWPGGESMDVPTGYGASLDVGDEENFSYLDHECEDDADLGSVRKCRQHYIEQRIVNWLTENPRVSSINHMVFAGHYYFNNERDGVTRYEPGFTLTGSHLGIWSPGYRLPVFTSSTWKGALEVGDPAHELGHALSAPHAGTTCGSNDDGQIGEEWRHDKAGRLQGTAFDPAVIALNGNIDPQVDSDTHVLFDVMSYCANQGQIDWWLSARNWNRATEVLTALRDRLGQASAAGSQGDFGRAFATGIAGATSGTITRVVPPDGSDRIPAPDPGSSLLLRSLSDSGATLLETGVTLVGSTDEGGPGGAFVGAVAANAARVELVRDGAVLDSVERSQPPRVRIRAPRAGANVRRGLVVRWSASDPEGAPLEATVEFSGDGRRWSTAFEGPSRGRARLPRSMLPAGRNARVRVTVNDGFAERTATSGRFRTAGSPPTARIDRPASGERLTTGSRVLLSGSAMDDRMRPLRGRALTWFAGRRRLGHGDRLAVRLPAGRVTLRLVARDSLGRTRQARRRVRVRPAPLRLLALDAPPHVGRRARTVPVTLRTSAPATLRIGGRRVRLGTRARRVAARLPARPKRGLLRLAYSIRPRGDDARGTIRGTLVILR